MLFGIMDIGENVKKIIKTIFGTIIICGTLFGIYQIGKYSFSVKLEEENDINEKINYKDMIASGEVKNKDYSNSVMYPYFELLSDNQKSLYNELLYAINKYEEDVIPSIKITVSEVEDAFYAVLYDHPELFWLGNSYSCEHYENNDDVTKILIKYSDIVNDIDNAKKKLDTVVNTIVKNANNYEFDYAKEKYVHDTLINLISYSKDTENHQSAYDALVNQKAVCAGYTKAFQLIMHKLGVPTYYVTGISTEDHAWNLIELEDGFYNIDLTFDDQIDRIIYKYYNIPDGLMNKDHTRTGLSTFLVKGDGFKYTNIYTTLIE